MKLICHRNCFPFVFGLVLIGLFSACSVKKNRLTNRIYHNLAAHYNAYWNGKESYNSGIKQLNANLQNNYAEILPVYNYGTEQDAKAISANLERAVQKASLVIQKHSMRFKNKEYNRWVDDAYLLIGKSYFYQKEFVSARRIFEFMMDEFKSTSSAYEAMLWLAKTYNQSGQFEKSDPLLKNFQELIDYESVPLSLQREYPMVYANFYLLQNKEVEAIDHLINAIEINKNKQLVTRLKFTLAQIYYNQENFSEASDLFSKIIHQNPEYDMAFNARINRARSFYTGAGNAEEIIASLETLLNDLKNEEYQDQIYFALAEIALKENNQSKAISYLRNSVACSTRNNFQKVSASITLADFYFNEGQYQDAKLYYDTAMQVIPANYPDYQNLLAKTDVLFSLVGYLETVQLQDSLQSLARMPETERMAVVDALIAAIAEKERVVQVEQQQRTRDLSMARQQNAFVQNNQQDGAWYFYNPSTLSFGFTEFINKWGRRPLEDNWRLSNKQTVSMQRSENIRQAEISNQEGSNLAESVVSRKDRNYYLKDIPLTEDQLLQSNKIIIEALFQSAMLFKEGLKDEARAISQFETLVNDYPENEYILQSYYYLHRMYASVDEAKTEHYKQVLLGRFPNSDYAKVLINPEYFRNLSAEKSEIESLYFDTYQAYENEQFYVSINLSERAIAEYSDSILIPKFEYIRALSIGKIEVIDSLFVNMQNLVQKYPQSEVVPLAQNLIDHLKSSGIEEANMSRNDLTDIAQSIGDYTFNPKSEHLYILIITSERVNLDAAKLRLSDFNLKRALAKPLTIASVSIDEDINWLSVLGLENMQIAQKYIADMVTDEYVLSMFNNDEYKHFVISVENYKILLRDRNISEYQEFYYKYYQTNY